MALGGRCLKVPKFLLCTFFILGIPKTLISWVFKAVGLSVLIDTDYSATASNHDQPQNQAKRTQSAVLVRKMLPAFKFKELMVSIVSGCSQDGCVVCLCAFEGEDEIRPLPGCRHIFHRRCLDSWIDHDHRTCPLCRTPLVSMDKMQQRFLALA